MKQAKHPGRSHSMVGVILTVLCGLVLWGMPVGDWWVNASYDYQFRFGVHAVTNHVSLILMDNAAFDQLHQVRGRPWDRELHAQLLNKLADDGCAVAVFDSFFRVPREAESDTAMLAAMRRLPVVLMAEFARVAYPSENPMGVKLVLPDAEFLAAAKTNWGVAWLDPDLDLVVRRHWPFPSPNLYPSLAWTTARLAGAALEPQPQERWLRYYGQYGQWRRMSYDFALSRPKNYFKGQTVFIGTEPQTTLRDGEPDKFITPYTRWTGEAAGGVEIMVTSFLNLMNGDWLRRPPAGAEFLLVTVAGILAGGGLCRLRLPWALGCGAAAAALVSVAAIWGSYVFNYWFPWLVVAGGQIPCALAWAAATGLTNRAKVSGQAKEKAPKIKGYKLFNPPFGQGAYGKVWLARTADKQWRAVKVVYLKNFEGNAQPYEREWNGISRFKTVSDRHPGLLRVDSVSEKFAGYFFYVMELGDSLEPGWEHSPQSYRPCDLASKRARAPHGRLPVAECIRIGIDLAEALEFLHAHGLTHRDIKPQNVIFVAGRPKLADMGLIAEIRPPEEVRTFIGTPGYMPPPPEPPGTPPADIYALGMLLYVISTGRSVAQFPELASSLHDFGPDSAFIPLNNVILTACDPDLAERYASAGELAQALRELLRN